MTYGYASSGWTNEPPYRPPAKNQPARRWHKCKARVRLRKAVTIVDGVVMGGVVYVGGPFYAPDPTIRKSLIVPAPTT
jgi:hypothetical protein